jgi:hypothetical protein
MCVSQSDEMFCLSHVYISKFYLFFQMPNKGDECGRIFLCVHRYQHFYQILNLSFSTHTRKLLQSQGACLAFRLINDSAWSRLSTLPMLSPQLDRILADQAISQSPPHQIKTYVSMT